MSISKKKNKKKTTNIAPHIIRKMRLQHERPNNIHLYTKVPGHDEKVK